MSHNTFGHLFRVTTFGESHGKAIGCVVDGCPPLIALEEADIQIFLDQRRPGQSRFTTQRKGERHRPHPVGPGARPRGAPGHHGHADRAGDRERGPALQGLRRAARHLPARPCRLHLRGHIRHPRPSRRRALVGARDGVPGGGRGDRAQGGCRASRSAGALVQMGERKVDRARWDWAEVARNPFFCPRPGSGEGLRDLSRRDPQGRLVRRPPCSRWWPRAYRRLGCAALRQARLRPRRRLHVDQRRQGRRDRRRLRHRRAAWRGTTPTRCGPAWTAGPSSPPITPAASWAGSRRASRSCCASR